MKRLLIRSLRALAAAIFAVVFPAVSAHADSPASTLEGYDAWRKRIPEAISNRLEQDVRALLKELGADLSPNSSKPTLWGNDYSNFDEDETSDWVIHVRGWTKDGATVLGCLIYDSEDSGWIRIASLPGTFPIFSGHPVEGRKGIRTIAPAPGEPPGTQRDLHFLWNGSEYAVDRVELSGGG